LLIRGAAEKKIYCIYNPKNCFMFDKKKPIIALTGATGFLGSHLMASMLSDGYKIIVLGRPTKKKLYRKEFPNFYNGSVLKN